MNNLQIYHYNRDVKKKKKKKERRVRETVRGCLCLTENKVGPIKLASVQEDENIWL